jgi:hypothetical protein
LAFLQADAVAWRKERNCSTCHHGTLTVWALSEAQSAGYAVDAKFLADSLAWTKERLERIDLPRDERPGWSMVNSPALYLATMAQAIPRQTILTEDELRRIADHLVWHQEADGEWSWASAPAKNRPPPFFESDEVATRLALIALRAPSLAQSESAVGIQASREKALAWLAKSEPNDTTQAAALRLVMHAGPADARSAAIERFVARQKDDGGWSQTPDRASDAYATGQALYVLNLVGVPRERETVQRGVHFLLTTQREDGSWPMTRRGHPGVTPGSFIVPITYFGSAWGTLGLIRSVER